MLLIWLTLALSACGQSDAEQVQSAFKRYLEAAASGDHREFCELQTLAERDNGLGYQDRHDWSKSEATVANCAAARTRGTPVVTQRQKDNVERVRVVDIEVRGDTAVAYLRLDGCTLEDSGARFVRTDDRWLFDGSLPTTKPSGC